MVKDLNYFNPKYPSLADVREKALHRIPKFAFEYLESGANSELNLSKNISEYSQVELMPEYLKSLDSVDLSRNLLGEKYELPFGIAPIGLQGLIWPNSPTILARAAHAHGIPFVLSTVSTASIESIAEATEGDFWFQLYHPSDEELKADILRRAWDAGCSVLVLLADTPTFGIRFRDVKNGLSMPPRMTLNNIAQTLQHPSWAMNTLRFGIPSFETLKPYMKDGMSLKQLGKFMNDTFDGRLTEKKIETIREQWKGQLIVKGIVNEKDLEKCKNLGADGIIVSNHGGRQIDAGESSLKSLIRLSKYRETGFKIMVDGGVRSGVDVAKAIACGADFVFMGRSFMYGVGALGTCGGHQVINLLRKELQQVMEQLGCENTNQLPKTLFKSL